MRRLSRKIVGALLLVFGIPGYIADFEGWLSVPSAAWAGVAVLAGLLLLTSDLWWPMARAVLQLEDARPSVSASGAVVQREATFIDAGHSGRLDAGEDPKLTRRLEKARDDGRFLLRLVPSLSGINAVERVIYGSVTTEAKVVEWINYVEALLAPRQDLLAIFRYQPPAKRCIGGVTSAGMLDSPLRRRLQTRLDRLNLVLEGI